MLVEPYIGHGVLLEEDARASRALWLGMPPHQGTLVAADESGAVIMAEVEDLTQAAATYRAVEALASATDQPGVTLHVAGPAAVSAFLSERIDADARVMQPLVFVMVLGFLMAANAVWISGR